MGRAGHGANHDIVEFEAKFVFLLDKSGQQIASTGELENVDPTSLASLTAGNVAATEGVAQLVGNDGFSSLFHEGKSESMHLSIVGERFVGGDPVGDTTLTQASIGFQIGGQAYTQIIFFEDERAFREFSQGGFEFAGNVNATVIKANAHAIASTAGSTAGASGGTDDVENVSPGYYKGMAVFIISTGGLMFEASISGQRFSYRPLAQAVDA